MARIRAPRSRRHYPEAAMPKLPRILKALLNKTRRTPRGPRKLPPER